MHRAASDKPLATGGTGVAAAPGAIRAFRVSGIT